MSSSSAARNAAPQGSLADATGHGLARIHVSTLGLKRLAACLAVAILVGLALAEPSQAALRFGVHSAGNPNQRTDDEIQRMAMGKVGIMRVGFDPRQLAGETKLTPVSDYDPIVARAAAAGVPLLPVLIGGRDNPPTNGQELAAYRNQVATLAARYGRNGTFWCQNDPNIGPGCSNAYRPITAWQVWNEPNLEFFWGDDPNAREYADLLEEGRRGLRGGDPKARIVMAGIPLFPRNGMTMESFLRRFYNVDGVKRQFDAAAIHPYARDEDGVEYRLSLMRSWLRDNGDRDRDVWITELGWGTDGTQYARDAGLVKSLDGQAKVLRRTFRMLQEERSRYNLKTVVWYDWRDTLPPPGTPNYFYYNTGLFKKDGAPKPSWDAFTDFTGGNDGGDTQLSGPTQIQTIGPAQVVEPAPDAYKVPEAPAE